MKIVGIIPARYQSSRYPGKPLAKILGKPMILYVLEVAAQALGKENVYVATDDDRISNIVEGAGYQHIMTSSSALTGTDRVYEASKMIEADIFVNIQGDEPMLDPQDIQKVVQIKKEVPDMVVNGMCPLSNNENPENINIPKVIANEKGRMIYMSRLAVPGIKEPLKRDVVYWKQVCIYAFNKEELRLYGEFGRKSHVEAYEDIEILRFFELGVSIMMVETNGASLAVDIPEDIKLVEKELLKKNEN